MASGLLRQFEERLAERIGPDAFEGLRRGLRTDWGPPPLAEPQGAKSTS